MDFRNKPRTKRRKLGIKEKETDIYTHNLQFYKIPPVDTISLFEFEDYAVERLRGRLSDLLRVHHSHKWVE